METELFSKFRTNHAGNLGIRDFATAVTRHHAEFVLDTSHQACLGAGEDAPRRGEASDGSELGLSCAMKLLALSCPRLYPDGVKPADKRELTDQYLDWSRRKGHDLEADLPDDSDSEGDAGLAVDDEVHGPTVAPRNKSPKGIQKQNVGNSQKTNLSFEGVLRAF